MEAGASASAMKPFKPQVFSSYGNGWRQLWKYFLELLLIGIIIFALAMAANIFTIPYLGLDFTRNLGPATAAFNVLVFAYSILFLNPVQYGVSFAFLKAARGNKLEIKDMFEVFKNYWNAVLANLLVAVIVVIGFILLIVPGIVFACKLAFVPYLVVDRKMDVISAVKTSWRMTSHGIAWKVFLIGLLAIPVVIAGLICLGVGVIISIMWITTAFASLYHAVDSADRAPAASSV